MRATQFRPPKNFNTENPDVLSRQLNQLGDEIAKSFVAVDDGHLPTPSKIVRVNSTVPGQKPYEPGQLVIADNAAGSLIVVIAAPSRELAGQMLPIAVTTTSANTVTIRIAPPPVGGRQGLVFGASQIVVAAAAVYLFFCDGQDWWV